MSAALLSTPSVARVDHAPRRPGGVDLDGSWVVDAQASRVAFSGRTSRLLPAVAARFPDVSGALDVDVLAGTVDIAVDIEVATVTSGNPVWDELIDAADPFAAHDHPLAYFRGGADGLGVALSGAGVAAISGHLTLRGIERPLALNARWTPHRAGLHIVAEGTVDRDDYGLRLDVPGLSRLMPRRMTATIEMLAIPA